MKTKLEQVISHSCNNREIVLWGVPSRLLKRELGDLKYRIAGDNEILSSNDHFVVFPAEKDMEDFFCDKEHSHFKNAFDYINWEDAGDQMPFDWEYNDAVIGKWTYFGDGVASACQNRYIKSIGRYTSINSKAVIHVDHQFNMSFVSDEVIHLFTDQDKRQFEQKLLSDPKLPGTETKSHALEIGNDVWIGANAFINCSKVKSIGDGAVVGSGAVVLQDVPPYAIVVGVPAQIKRYRYEPKMIETLLRIKWWEWSDQEIQKNADALIDPALFLQRFGYAL